MIWIVPLLWFILTASLSISSLVFSFRLHEWNVLLFLLWIGSPVINIIGNLLLFKLYRTLNTTKLFRNYYIALFILYVVVFLFSIMLFAGLASI
ncbi:hypothetical protein [Chengkuizengella axinellae]|uniref:Uncharacterized protein n=1 Tax=Chengkuizengella axinellae TaxID=3064388 RepID=A0ABT9J3J2_9BACL|nr:hypothetical protein [Chengkuizengella sp. 2205SS18-9]MDP5276190.1 hypothetical protein [Chengkuizengella sp. 2205SS18-9]